MALVVVVHLQWKLQEVEEAESEGQRRRADAANVRRLSVLKKLSLSR